MGRSKDFPDSQYTQTYGSVDVEKLIAEKQKAMEAAAKNLDFITAAKLRDEIVALKG